MENLHVLKLSVCFCGEDDFVIKKQCLKEIVLLLALEF